MPPIAGLQYLLEYYMLLLFMKTKFLIWIQTANRPGFEPGSSGPKAAMLTIELHSIDNTKFIRLKSNSQKYSNYITLEFKGYIVW